MESIIGSLIIQLLLAQHQLERLATERAYASEVRILDVPELKALAQSIAAQHGIGDVWRFLAVAQCESGWDTNVRSRAYQNGVRENSWGIFQINLDAHKSVTRGQAIDPHFNIQWAADHWDDASSHWKICYRRVSGLAGR